MNGSARPWAWEPCLPKTLRRCFDRHAGDFERIARHRGVELLEKVQVPVTKCATGHAALDMDVFCLGDSKIQKEGLSRTDQGSDGYTPIGGIPGIRGMVPRGGASGTVPHFDQNRPPRWSKKALQTLRRGSSPQLSRIQVYYKSEMRRRAKTDQGGDWRWMLP
jgi:hypothetical protein